jgi:hypothetical protein
MREIKLGFCDFWSGFDPTTDNIFGKVLKKHFNIVYDNNEPDFLIFSVYGSNHRKYKNCVKIMFCPENFLVFQQPHALFNRIRNRHLQSCCCEQTSK